MIDITGKKPVVDLTDVEEEDDYEMDIVEDVKGTMNELCQNAMEAGDCLEKKKKEAVRTGGGHNEALSVLAGKMATVEQEVSRKEAQVSRWTGCVESKEQLLVDKMRAVEQAEAAIVFQQKRIKQNKKEAENLKIEISEKGRKLKVLRKQLVKEKMEAKEMKEEYD